VSNFFKAFEANLTIIPVINKIDAGSADVSATEDQLLEQLDFDLEEILYISAKVGTGVQSVFQAIIDRIPPPTPPNTN
jgi:GTP-binding protein LepA